MTSTKLGCTPEQWLRLATKAALRAGVSPAKVVSGCQEFAHVRIRWSVWRDLCHRGYSYNSIAKSSGFDHTAIRHAHLTVGPPRKGGNADAIRNIHHVRARLDAAGRAHG